MAPASPDPRHPRPLLACPFRRVWPAWQRVWRQASPAWSGRPCRGTAAAAGCWAASGAACWAPSGCPSGGAAPQGLPSWLPGCCLAAPGASLPAPSTTLPAPDPSAKLSCEPQPQLQLQAPSFAMPPLPACSGALELVGSVSAGLASSAGVVRVPQPRRPGRLLLSASEGEEAEGGGAVAAGAEGSTAAAHGGGVAHPAAPVVAAAARLMQHPMLLGHFLVGSSEDAGGTAGLGRYQGHAPLQSATVLQGAQGLRSAHFARGFALRLPLLLVTEHAAVLFSAGGLEAVLVLPLVLSGEPARARGGVGGRLRRAEPTNAEPTHRRVASWPAAPAGPPSLRPPNCIHACRSGGPLLKPRAQVLLPGGRPRRAACCGRCSCRAVPAQPRRLAAAGAAAAEKVHWRPTRPLGRQHRQLGHSRNFSNQNL